MSQRIRFIIRSVQQQHLETTATRWSPPTASWAQTDHVLAGSQSSGCPSKVLRVGLAVSGLLLPIIAQYRWSSPRRKRRRRLLVLPVDVAAAVYVAKAGRTGSLDTVRWRATQSRVSTHNHAQTYLPESFKPPQRAHGCVSGETCSSLRSSGVRGVYTLR